MVSKRSITIRVQGLEDAEAPEYAEVEEAFCSGIYAYHSSPVAAHIWNVTHIPTGIRLLTNLSRLQALALVERLVKEAPSAMITVRMGLSMEEYQKHEDFELLKKICLG